MPARPAFFSGACAAVIAVIAVLALQGLLTGCTTSPPPTQPVSAANPDILITLYSNADGFADAARPILAEEFQGQALAYESTVSTEPIQLPSPPEAPLRLKLNLTYRNMTETEFETIWRTTTLFLLTLYPSTCQHRAYTLTATLSDDQGHSRVYEKNDKTLSWLWLMNGRNCGETPTREEVAAVTNRLLQAVAGQIRDDGVLAGAGLDAPDVKSPMVGFVVDRGEEIAAQVLSVDRPFKRWVVNKEDGEPPNYRIDLCFDVYPGGFSILRGYLGILTIGLTSPCRWSTVTLAATVTGPHAATTRSYLFKRTLIGRMQPGGIDSPGCEQPDETSRPEVFAELLRELLEQISQDGLISMQAPPSENSLPPLVHVSAVRAAGIVRRETLKAAAFERYYFHETQDYLPDYTLALDIRFFGGGRKDLSFAGSMGAALGIAYGLNFYCEPTVMSLDAVLSDREGTELRRYHTEREEAFSNNVENAMGCRDNDTTNPEAVGKLVRELYALMDADGTLAGIAARNVAAR